MMRWRVQILKRWNLQGEVVEGLVEKMDHFGMKWKVWEMR